MPLTSASTTHAFSANQQIEQFRTIITDSPDYIILMDNKLNYRAVSHSFCQFLGKSEEDLIGKNDFDVFPTEEAKNYRESDLEVIDSRKLQVLFRDVMSSSGRSQWLKIIKVPLYSEDGMLDRVLVCAHDISDLKQLGQESRDPSLLEAQFEATLDGILVVDENGMVVSVNERMLELWQVPKELSETKDDTLLLKHALSKLVDPEQFLKKVNYLYSHPEEKSKDELELKDGRFFERYSSPLIDSNSCYHGRIWYFHDITERKNTENRLRDYHDELEQLVEERTAELKKKNEQLQKQISRHVKTENALKRSEDRYRALYNDNPSTFFTLDKSGVILSVNKFGAGQIGYSVEEITGIAVHQLLPDEQIAKFDELVQTCLEDPGTLYSGQLVKCHKDGHLITCESFVRAVPNINGELILLTVCHDISERLQAEEKVKLATARYHRLFDKAPIMYVTTIYRNGSQIITDCNDQFSQTLGYQKDDVLNHSLIEFYTPEYQKKIVQNADYAEAFCSGYVSEERDLQTKDGRTVNTLLRAIPDNRTGEELGETWAMFVDVTDQRQSQFEIQWLQQFYESILDSIPLQIAVYNMDGCYIYLNPACAKDPGIRQWLIGKTDLDFCLKKNLPVSLADDRKEMLNKVMTEKKEFTLEEEYPSVANGIRNIIRTFCPIIDSEGEVTHIIGLSSDVTERKALEAQMYHAQKLESVGVLAGGIAHDFNNILTGILGNASLVVEDLPKKSPLITNVKTIESAARQAAELCYQLLAYSGKGRFFLKAININKLVSETTNLLKVSISKTIDLNFELASELPFIEGDAAQIRQVLLNLVINASDAIGEKVGNITLKTGAIHPDESHRTSTYYDSLSTDQEYVFLEVVDTGHGMDKETVSKIFDPFFTTKPEGHGLGLASLIGIVRGHKGGIDVKSEVNKGTRIRVMLPANSQTPRKSRKRREIPEGWKGEGTVLIVDDEEHIRKVARTMFGKLGFQTKVAADGVEAVSMFKKNQSDIVLVLLDITMPRLGGKETLLKLEEQKTNVPVLLSSGYDKKNVLQEFVGQENIEFIKKPYRFDDLVRIVHRLLTRTV
ncbi:MAG: PAS domain S-box protein [Calditrichia bacterium]